MGGPFRVPTWGSARLRDATRLLTALVTVLGTGCYATVWKPLPPKLPDRRVIELKTADDTLSLWRPRLEGDSIIAGQTLPHGVRYERARTEDWSYVRIPVGGTLYKTEHLRNAATVLLMLGSIAALPVVSAIWVWSGGSGP
jgi:hypothetical protein